MQLSEVSDPLSSFRIDAEYYRKRDVDDLRMVERLTPSLLKDLTTKIDVGYVGSMVAEYTENVSDPVILQTRNIDEFIPNSTDLVHISEAFHRKLTKSQIHENNLLIARSGSFGNAAVWLSDKVVNSSDIIIVGADEARIRPCYLAAFLNGRFGRFQLERFASGAVQCHVNLTILENLKIPILSNDLQELIDNLVHKAFDKDRIKKTLYEEAESLLLRELGFEGWNPPSKTVAVRKYSDFIFAGRFDAEYFQPDCDSVAHKLAEYPHGCVLASEMLQAGLVKSGTGSQEKYVELADIGASGEIIGCTEAPFEELPSRARQRIHTGDVIVSSIEGSLERCAFVDDEYDGALCSTGFHRFRSSDINAETLLLLFKSAPIQRLLKRGCSGTILCGILPDEFKRIPIPLIIKSVQVELAKKIKASFAARKESKRLLELAKRAVEVAIESGEAAGMKLLREN